MGLQDVSIRTIASVQTGSQKPSSLWRDAWRDLCRNKLAMVGLIIVCVFILTAVFAPVIAPHDPIAFKPRDSFQPPNATYLLGTDHQGRDTLSRVIFGARVSLSVGLISVSLAVLAGTVLGLLAGYFRGLLDLAITGLFDMMYIFPSILLALVFMAIFGRGIDRVTIAIGIVFTPYFGRLVRGVVLAEREKAYVEAARALGSGDEGILFRHILPNILSHIIVMASLSLSFAILWEAGLSFLGMGTQPPTASWGAMLSQGREVLHHSPWLVIWPGLAIMLVVFGLNALGDGLRDALDPKLKRQS